MFNLRPDGIYRPVDWRWQKALALRRAGRGVSRKGDDESVSAAVAYQNERDRVTDDNGLLGLLERWPHLTEAHQIWTHSQRNLRSELEARLLSGAPAERVAARMGLKKRIVEWYERVFFHVTDRLDCPSWVAHVVLGPGLHDNLNLRDRDLIWKLFGYGGGEHVLDSLVGLFTAPSKPADAGGVKGFFASQGRAGVERAACLNSLAIRCTDPYQQLQLLELQAKYHELESAARAGAADDTLLANLRSALSSLSWRKARKPAEGESVPSAEPRASELIERAFGGRNLQPLPDDMPAPSFPERAPRVVAEG